MDLEKFIQQRPFLYHLTNSQNATNIILEKKIYSTNKIIDLSLNKDYENVKRQKRLNHQEIIIDSKKFSLRDQRPISEKALAKCLSDGWNVGDFLHHLNDRVFMWPSLDRLWRHFNRYEQEKPIIFRFSTREIIDANPHVKFSRLNSGATRANSHLGGKAPERGPNTFLSSNLFNRSIRDVAEVTFENECLLSCEIQTGSRPDSTFTKV